LVWGGQFSLANLANTAAAAARVGAVEGMQLRVGGLVKSIDDDASIPPGYHSIGFSSASAALARTLKNLMRDARQSDTLIHVPVLSGNQVGCLTEAAARGAGCPLYIIPERLPKRCSLQLVLETIFGAWLKGAIRDQPSYHLVVPIAEGILGSLDPASCPGLKEARDRYREGVTANHFPLPTIIQDQLGAMFAELSLPHGIKVSVRSAYHGYAARGSEANSTDREMASLHVTTALRAMAQGESGRVYYGSGQHCHSLVLTGLLTEDGQGRERQVDLKDPVIAAHWNAIRPHRLTSEDLSHEQLARIAAFLQLPTKDVQDRFDLVAGIAN
jgi:6-phosphofructokinase